MDRVAKMAELFRQLRQPKGDIFFYATVTAITDQTCSVKITDLELTDVRLKATVSKETDMLLLTPKVGSMVVVGANHGDWRDLVVVKVDDPQRISYKHKDVSIDIDGESGKIVINEGKNGGLTITPELKDQLENMTKRIDAAFSLLKKADTASLYPNTTAWANIYLLESETLVKEDFSDIENENIKH